MASGNGGVPTGSAMSRRPWLTYQSVAGGLGSRLSASGNFEPLYLLPRLD